MINNNIKIVEYSVIFLIKIKLTWFQSIEKIAQDADSILDMLEDVDHLGGIRYYIRRIRREPRCGEQL
mgnify:FL=1